MINLIETPDILDEKLLKLLQLLEILQKATHKNLDEPSNLPKFISFLKQLQTIHSICLIELLHILQSKGLDSLSKVFLKLFQSYKSQLFYLLQYHQQNLRLKDIVNKEENQKKPNEVLISEDFLVCVVNLLEKLDYRHQYYMKEDMNRFEKLEKAKFFLEKEGLELEEMLLNYKSSRDEIDTFIKNRKNFKNITASGVMKFLQGFFTENRESNSDFKRFIIEGKFNFLFYH